MFRLTRVAFDGRLGRVRTVVPRFSSQAAAATFDNTLIVTRRCARQIKALQKKFKSPEMRLRVAVEGGGCSGFQYTFEMEAAELDEEDLVFEREGGEVVVDESSFELIKGATIDYEQELIRSAFAVVNNPQSESACGCGSSFALKNFTANPAID